MVRRFLAERDHLSRMAHPGIAKILDAGATPDGRPYVAMDLVCGQNIVEYCCAHRLTVADRVKLVVDVCRAIHHAHQRAVLHRDIKPSNILIAETDGMLRPVVIDFGIARVLSADGASNETMTGDLVGTPRYMSPEQLVPGANAPDIRTDVFALGVLLCEVLTGEVPREPADLRAHRVSAERPSRLALRDAAGPTYAEKSALSKRLRGDLDRIILKCVEWDLDDRYDSAAELANDLERFLNGEPVLASEPGVAYRVRKFIVRNKTISALTAVAIVSLAMGTAVASIGLLDAIEQRDRARVAKLESDRQAARARVITQFFLEDLLAAADPDVTRGENIAVADLLDDATRRADERFADDLELRFDVLSRIGKAYATIGRDDDASHALERAVKLGQEVLGDDDPRVLDSELAYLRAGHVIPGHNPEDLPSTSVFRDRVVGLLGQEHPLSLEARVFATLQIDDVAQTIGELEQVMSLLEQAGLADASVYFEASSHLSLCLAKVGRLSEAEELARRNRQIAERLYGPVHTATVRALYYRTQFLLNLGRYADADQLATELLDTSRQLYREDDVRLRTAIHTVVRARLAAGNTEDAIRAAKERFSLTARYDGVGSVAHSTAGHSLANTLIRVGRFSDAMTLLDDDVLAARRSAWGDDSSQVGGTLGLAASACLGLHRYEDCVEYADRALERLRPHGIHATKMVVVKAKALHASGQVQEALELLGEHLREPIVDELSPESHQVIRNALAEIAGE